VQYENGDDAKTAVKVCGDDGGRGNDGGRGDNDEGVCCMVLSQLLKTVMVLSQLLLKELRAPRGTSHCH
jgi:hypothetical protein